MNSKSKAPVITTRKLIVCALMVAMIVVLTRLLGINTQILKINFAFIPVLIVAMCYGPVYCAIVCALADIIGTFLIPTGAFNPLFTLVEVLAGLTYGLFLYRPCPIKKLRTVLISFFAAFTVHLVFSLCVNSLLLHWYFNIAYAVLLPTRLVKFAVLVPLQTIVTPILWMKLMPLLSKWSDTPIRKKRAITGVGNK